MDMNTNYINLPDKVLHTDLLSSRQKILYADIMGMNSDVMYGCYKTNRQFANMLNCSASTISAELKDMYEKGFIYFEEDENYCFNNTSRVIIANEIEPDKYFVKLPFWLIYDQDLSDNEKILYAEISALSYKNKHCTAKNRYFANLLRVTPRTIQIYLNHLADRGCISVEVNRFSFFGGTTRKIFANNRINEVIMKVDNSISVECEPLPADFTPPMEMDAPTLPADFTPPMEMDAPTLPADFTPKEEHISKTSKRTSHNIYCNSRDDIAFMEKVELKKKQILEQFNKLRQEGYDLPFNPYRLIDFYFDRENGKAFTVPGWNIDTFNARSILISWNYNTKHDRYNPSQKPYGEPTREDISVEMSHPDNSNTISEEPYYKSEPMKADIIPIDPEEVRYDIYCAYHRLKKSGMRLLFTIVDFLTETDFSKMDRSRFNAERELIRFANCHC